MEASIREPNIKHFVRLLQCAAKYGDDLCMHATVNSWELIVTNSTKSAYVCFTLEPAFFSRYKAHGNATEQRRGIKCQLYAKSMLGVLGKASSVNAVERVDLKIVDDEGGLRAKTMHSDDEEDDDIRVASRTAHLELKLVYHHGITKKHFLHLQASDGLRVVVDTETSPSTFTVSARVLRDWLDHFTIAFGSGTASNGVARGDSHLAWHFAQDAVKVKNYETATTSTLATEITIDTRDFSNYDLAPDCVELSLPMREFKGTLQLAEQLGMDLDFWFSEASQPMAITSTFLGLDRYGNETHLFKILCAIATSTTDAFNEAPPSSNRVPRDRAPTANFAPRRSVSTSIKSESETRSASVASDRNRQPSESISRRGSARPRASLTMTVQPEAPPPMVTVVGGPAPFAASQGAGPNDEALFLPGASQGPVRMSQQEVFAMAGIDDLDLAEVMDDDDDEDLMGAAEAPAAPDVPNGWEDLDADFDNIPAEHMSTQRENIVAAQQRPSQSASSISQRPFSMSRQGSRPDSIRQVEASREPLPETIARTGTRELRASESRETIRPASASARARESEPSRAVGSPSRSRSREPSRALDSTSRSRSREGSRPTSRPTSRQPSVTRSTSRPANGHADSSDEFKPDLEIFGAPRGEEEVIGDDEELGPTQGDGRVFETLFDD